MDVRLSPEQVALRDSAAQMMDRLAPATVRDLDDAERRAKLDAAVEAAGWRDLRTAADGHNHPMASAVEASIIAEELGRGLADTPFLGPTLAAELRRLSAAPPGAERETVLFVPDLSAPADVSTPRPVAIDSQEAASALLLRPMGADRTLVRLTLGPAGAEIDLTRDLASPDGTAAAEVEAADRALSGDDLQKWWALGLALTCSDLVGVMRGVLRLAGDYAASRRQYGVPVGSFQAVQHMLADALVAMEGSRSVALHAAWSVDALPPAEALVAASTAKAYCARAARSVCETGIQVHGGIGNTWDCLAHVFLRRALLSSDILGGVGANLARVLAHNGIGEGNGLR
ncbi:MAG TPA: acyl-CoA dehydrogenase [Acidimicrobiales bacterium]|nr:acyl-CoA dehydrogenase [Acidimicrobiales bacterium]